VWLPDGEKNFDDMFIRFDTIHERDRHTHTHTQSHRQTPHNGIARAYASRGKNRGDLLTRVGLL